VSQLGFELPDGSYGDHVDNGSIPTSSDSANSGLDEPRRLSLARLAVELARSVSTIGMVTTVGEVNRPSRGQTGRIWFTLKERSTQIRVSVSAARARGQIIEAGEQVEITGTIVWLGERGEAQLEAMSIVPVGAGAIAARILATRRQLAAEGILDRPRRAIPLLPQMVGVVCGTDAAVRHDIESVVVSRFAGYPVRFLETTVQGPMAVDSIIRALDVLDRDASVSVIILARGGGDATALLPFSDEAVCRAIAACTKPVVSAIGHDADRPLSDEVADLRCGTPSIAAATVIPDYRALVADLDGQIAYAANIAERRLTRHDTQLERLDPRVVVRNMVERKSHQLTMATSRLAGRHPGERLANATKNLDLLMSKSQLLSPQHVLNRGYAIVKAGALAVRDPSDVTDGQQLDVVVARGSLSVIVQKEAT